MNKKEIYNNNAKLDNDRHAYTDLTEYECCSEDLAFAMKDNYHTFSIGLSTIVHCLAIAEHEGYVPKLPSDWWINVKNRLF